MPFTFTFSIAVPGISNPFSAQNEPRSSNSETNESIMSDQGYVPSPAPRRPHPATLPPPEPLARKRGWVPAEAEPSRAATINASSSGYLDTPAKYRDMASEGSDQQQVEEMVGDLPPAKRRRTLAGSIVSTAVSAALIGTAVGLTVYRLWRDRGREPELAPPPPYEQGNWVHPEDTPPVKVTPPTPRGKRARPAPAPSRRPAPRHRRTRTRGHIASAPSRQISPPTPHVQPEFDFSSTSRIEEDVEVEVDDKMDWMGDRLAKLIEEGKKALGKEVVVMSEAQEDEEDDGSGNWEEEPGPSSSSRRGSFRRKHRPQNLGLPSSHAPSSYTLTPPSSSSPRRGQFNSYSQNSPYMPESPRGLARGASVESVHSYKSFHDDMESLSPELRETMEQIRAAKYRNRS